MLDGTIFCPASVAIVGASSDSAKEKEGWVGRLLSFGYSGKIYPINPKATEVLGLKAYPSVKAIPSSIDFAIFNVAAFSVPSILRECAEKGVKAAHVFTAGFRETGDPEGIRIENEIEKIAKETGIRVIGPNCLGLYSASGGLTFANLPRKVGPAAFVSQTGTGALRIITYGHRRGVYFDKVVSYGNATDLDSTDFIELLAEDPEVKYLGCYIEGVREVSRFTNVVRSCAQKIPVVMLKVGATEASREAAASHTGAMAGTDEIWRGFLKQSGVIRVQTLEDIVEQIVALRYLSPPRGRRVGIIGRGGGPGVVATEICEKAGLKVPSFSPELRGQLNQIVPVAAGSSIRNPVEIGVGASGASPHYAEAFRMIADSLEIDFILTHLNPDSFIHWGGDPEWLLHSVDALLNVFRTLSRPVALILVPGEYKESATVVNEAWQKCIDGGLAVFRSYDTAVRMIANLIWYQEFKERVHQ